MSKEEIEDSISNLKFNRATIRRNGKLRGVVFREVRVLCHKINKQLKTPYIEQLLNLIDDEIIRLEIKLEEHEENELQRSDTKAQGSNRAIQRDH